MTGQGGLPILSVRQKKVKLLGNPFKDCRERDAAKIHSNPLMVKHKNLILSYATTSVL